MKAFISVWFVLFICVQTTFQQSNQRQQQLSSLTYSESEYNLKPAANRPTVDSTSVAPETTTKKKGFFSGITGFFSGKSKDKEVPTTQVTTTQATTTLRAVTSSFRPPSSSIKPTAASIPETSTKKVSAPFETPFPTSTAKLLPRFESSTAGSKAVVTSTPSVKTSSTTLATARTPKPKDEFPPLPTQTSNRPIIVPSSTASPQIPNAWNKPPGILTDVTQKPFFTQSTSTTRKPQIVTQSSQPGVATDAELLTLSESLFSKDIHNPFKYVTVNYQGRTQSSATTDEASQMMLAIDKKLFSLSTVEKMMLLYNNYEQDTAINEYVSPNEKKEEDEFLDAVLATPVMRHAMNFLSAKGILTPDPQTHRDLLKTIWFNLYSRGMGKIGSSGFEHVFLSEVKNGTVMGLHNWIYMSEAERTGDLNYQGWLKKIDLGNKGQIAKVRFTLNNLEKPSNSLFIGTSPELELALYTVCFELRADQDCRLAYGGKDFNIVTHSYRYRGKKLIGSAYPEI